MISLACARAVGTMKTGSNETRPVYGMVPQSKKTQYLLMALALVLSGCGGNNPPNTGTLKKALDSADETVAIQNLRTIASAQTQAKAIRGSYSDFPGLVDGGFLDQRFAGASPTVRGYVLTMASSPGEFSIKADPTGSATGRHFYLDSNDDSIHVNPNASAAKTDPTL